MALFNGSTPWEQRFGWLPHEKRSTDVKKIVEGIMSNLPTFEIKGAVQDSAGKKVVLWDAAVKVLGKHIDTFTQEIGDCFIAGTMVAGPVTKPIEEIRVGDEVYTADGKLTRVISTREKHTYQPMVRVRAYGLPATTCTADHRFLVYRLPKISGKRMTANRYQKAKNGNNHSNAKVITQYEERKAEWVRAEELRSDDVLLTPIHFESRGEKPEHITIGDYALGYFAGNGHASGGTVEWTGPLSHRDRSEDLQRDLIDSGYAPTYTEDQNKDAWRVRINDKALVEVLRGEFYEVDGNKRFPQWAYGNKRFVEGLHAADGFISSRHVRTFDSVSPSLITGMLVSLTEDGMDLSVGLLSRSKGTFANAKPLYRLMTREEKKKQLIWRDDKYVCHPVRKVERIEGPAVVYDIGVENDQHSFLANWTAVHNCVANGSANVCDYLQCVQISLGATKDDGTPMTYHEAFRPYIYGISRVQIGGGQLGGSDGSVGAWAAEGCKKYGVLRSDFTGVPPYSGSIARQWGRSGPPKEFITEGQKFLVKTYAQVNSYEEVRDAIVNGYPVTVASNQGFRMTLQDRGGKLFGVPSGSWSHQMCFIGVDDADSKYPGCYCMNSWGANAFSPGHKNGEPPGGFWVDPDTVTRMCRAQDTFAYSNFDGFPGQKLDFMLI